MKEDKKCIGIITNLNSKRNKKNKYNKFLLQPIIGEWGTVIDTKNFEEMENAIKIFIDNNVKYLGINGGDGTVQKVVTKWIQLNGEENLPYIIPIAGGSTNAINRFLNQTVHSSPVALRKFMKKFLKNSVDLHETPLIKVEGNNELLPAYGFTFANGTVYKFIKRYLKNGKPGIRWVFSEIMKTIGGMTMGVEEYMELVEEIEAEVKIDGRLFPSNRIKAAVATTLDTPFPGITPFRDVNRLRGEIYYVVSNLDIFTAVRNIHHLLWSVGDMVYYKNSLPHWKGKAKNIDVLHSNSGFIIDGELFELENLDKTIITAGPNINLAVY